MSLPADLAALADRITAAVGLPSEDDGAEAEEPLPALWDALRQAWWESPALGQNGRPDWPAFFAETFPRPQLQERILRAVHAEQINGTEAANERRKRFERARDALGLTVGTMYLHLGAAATSVGSLKAITSLRFSPGQKTFQSGAILAAIAREMNERHNDDLVPPAVCTIDITKAARGMLHSLLIGPRWRF